MTEIQRNHTPQTFSDNGKQESPCQINSKGSEKAKGKNDYENVQSVQGRELRRSPRGLSKNNFQKLSIQKEIFQTKMKSEVIDVSTNEALSPIKQNKKDVSNNRGQMKIKDSWSAVAKTTEKLGGKTNLTFSTCADVNLQCIQERELRRSPRGLSKDTNRKSSFQKEIFQKNIKSEVDDSIVYEVSPKQQHKTDASNNRELMKIKGCLSSIVSPHDKTTGTTKEKSDDRTLQCVLEKKLRPSPRTLSSDSNLTSNFQKEIFQKNIKSEAEDLSAYEANPKNEYQINAIGNREPLKIKGCCSPIVSPHDKTTERAKETSYLSFSKFDDRTLQCVLEKKLRRSPRNLSRNTCSKRTSNFQKVNFQNNIKSEVEDSIVHEVSPKQHKTDASNNRELLKIKGCFSPIVSPHDKTTARTKETSDLSFSKSDDRTLQCDPEKKLRRSPRALSSDSNLTSNFQKEIFQKNIKSEAEDLSAYEVNPKNENQVHAFSNRELLKIKGCCSPIVSPHDKTTARTKETSDLSFSKSNDRTLQCDPEKKLRRSPRALSRNRSSNLGSNFQKEIFQKYIKSEAEDLGAYEVNPKNENQIHAFSNRELLKIKDCWSPKTSPKDEIILLRNGRKLQLTPPSQSKNVQSLKDGDNSTGNIQLMKAGHKRDSHQSACNYKDSNLNIYKENSDKEIKTEEMYGPLPRRKKLRSETTDDELWEGLPQNKRFKRLTPKKGTSVVKTDDKHHDSSKSEQDDVMTDERKILSNLIVPLSNHNEISNAPPISIEKSIPDISETDKDTQPRNESLLKHLIGTSPPCNPTGSMNMSDGDILCIKDSCCPDTKKGRVRRNLSKELAKSPEVDDDVLCIKDSCCPDTKKGRVRRYVSKELSKSPEVDDNVLCIKDLCCPDTKKGRVRRNLSKELSKSHEVDDDVLCIKDSCCPDTKKGRVRRNLSKELSKSHEVDDDVLCIKDSCCSDTKKGRVRRNLSKDLSKSPEVDDDVLCIKDSCCSNTKKGQVRRNLSKDLSKSLGVLTSHKNNRMENDLVAFTLTNARDVSTYPQNDKIVELELANSPGVSTNLKYDEIVELELANSPGVSTCLKKDKINYGIVELELTNSPGFSTNLKHDEINDEIVELQLANSPGVPTYPKKDKINDEIVEFEREKSPGISTYLKNDKINEDIVELELTNSPGVSTNLKYDKINDEIVELELANSPAVSTYLKNDKINDEIVELELTNSPAVSTCLKNDKINDEIVELELTNSPAVSTNLKHDEINDEIVELELANSPAVSTYLKNDKINDENVALELVSSPGVSTYLKNDNINDEIVELELVNSPGVSTNLKHNKVNDEIVELELENSTGFSTYLKNKKIHDKRANSKTTKEAADTSVIESDANSKVTDTSVEISYRIQDRTEYAIADGQHRAVLEHEQGDDNVSNQTNEQIPRNEIVAKRNNGDDNYPMTDNNSSVLLYSVRNSDTTHFTNGAIKFDDNPHEQGCNTDFQAEYQPRNINVDKKASMSAVSNNAKVAEHNDSSTSNTSFLCYSIGTDSGINQQVTCFQDIECDERNRDDKYKRCPLLEKDSDFEPNFQCGDNFCSTSLGNNMEETICYEMDELSPEVLNKDDNTTNQATFQISDQPETIVENVAFHRWADDFTIPELIVENKKYATENVERCNASDKETDGFAVDDELVEDECDQTLKVNTEKSITRARHPTHIVVVTPSKQSAHLRDKRTITPSIRLDDFIIYDLDQHANDVSRKHKIDNRRYTSIKNKRRKIDYGVDSNLNSNSEINSDEENTCSMQTPSLPLKSNSSDDDFLHDKMSDIKSDEKVDEKSDVDEEIKSKVSNKPAIKLRMQKIQDGFARIIQPTELQRLPYIPLSRTGNEQRNYDKNSAGNSCKKISQSQLPKSNTSTVEKYGHCKSTKRKLENRDSKTRKSFSRPKRRQRSPEEDIRIMPERRCRRKNESKEELLKNGTVGKHASILWLSENRRHFVQKHSHCSSAELDAIVTSAWRNLADKEKLPFYLRARNAMRDENKHSTHKSDKSANGTPSQSVSRKMQQFLCLSPIEQYNELKRWLALVHEVSPGEYAKLIANFKATMKKEKLQRQNGKSQGSSCDSESHHRRSLFQKILDIREKIVDIYHLKKEKQMEFVKDEFDATIRQLIAGEEVKFADGVVSQELEQVLSDLKSLENELKVAVSGTPLKSRSYENILEDLKQCEHVPSETSALSTDILDILEDLPHADSKYADDLLQETLHCKQIGIDSQSVSEFFNEEIQDTEAVDVALTEDNLKCLSDFFENEARLKISNSDPSGRTSPSQILTNWALADQFKYLAKKGILIDSGSKMQIDQKHLLPFLRGKDIFNPSVPKRQATLHQGVPCTRKPRPSNNAKNNNAKRIRGISKYDKYKRTTSNRPVIVHYSRPFKPLSTSFYEHQLQLQLKRKLLQQKEHVSLNPTFNSLRNKPRIASGKPKGRVTLQNKIEERPIVGQESDFENNVSRMSPSEYTEDEMSHNQTSPISENRTRNSKNNITPPFVGRRNYSAHTEQLNQSSSLSSLSGQKTDATTKDESTYSYTHSVIHRRIEHVQGRTVVRFTATAFDGRRISSI